ncbi:alpha-L-fucosidase [Massilia terrae]|uniref:alpha-L-fucosidase n=1 Tax=Massilia terrae TaxID=1811224 RepID=A0ABT2CV26_9BURK|nr:alpha-L-fucosidase [Massilia terrae]MCS0657825.1 alpha-L-fucosidase [Massilia terrae]
MTANMVATSYGKRMAPCLRIPLFAALVALSLTARADERDEDSAMFNSLNTRDLLMVREAVNGWWKEADATRNERIAWWRVGRFGMFIHWGVYSQAGGVWNGRPINGYAEHLMRKEKISRADYLKLASSFDPERFDADAWVAAAKAAGMGYLIITAKHHDGFAMYDSKVSDFNIVQKTPFKRDPVAELAAACHRQGLKFGVYYSHAFDWEHPDAPGNDWEYNNPGGDKNLFGGRSWYDSHPEKLPAAIKYVNEKAIPQLQELLARYPIDILWFDTPHKLPLSENLRILKAVRAAKPNVVVNGRLASTAGINFGDYRNTADRPSYFFPVVGDWEAIPTTNESYGYSAQDRSHKPVAFFIRLLADAVSRNGNLLLNIGPKGDGVFDAPDAAILSGMASWMTKNGASIHGAGPAPLPRQNWGVATAGAGTLYLHVFERPVDGRLHVGGIAASDIASARILGGPDTMLAMSAEGPDGCMITLPAGLAESPDLVIALEPKPSFVPVEDRSELRIAPNIPVTTLLAFDATLAGNGFRFGDGKAQNYGVAGWTSTAQFMAWHVRTLETANYTVTLRHAGAVQGQGALVVDGKLARSFDAGGESGDIKLGEIALSPGAHRIELKALRIDGKEFLTPNAMRLTRSEVGK